VPRFPRLLLVVTIDASEKKMEWSKYNVFSRIHGSSNYFLFNPLRGEADILSPDQAVPLLNHEIPADPLFAEKGYVADRLDEEALFRRKYLEFVDNRDSEEIQIFFVPWYSCNFACGYCFQDEYEAVKPDLSQEAIDGFFSYIKKKFIGRKRYITLFGGEPLLPAAQNREYLRLFLTRASAEGLSVAIVTNGYHLKDYADILNLAIVREIQVTLDGLGEGHDQRRPLKGGGPTFSAIVDGIDMALANHMPVNLRMVVDKDNVGSLPELARFARERGWTQNPLFKTQIGRNYELHHCQSKPERLFERAELYEKLHSLSIEFPEFAEFHRPSFSVVKFLYENGKLPDPLFDSCPGTKSEWAFDSAGRIFSCTATVGKASEALGTYFPVEQLNEGEVALWETRDITTIPECLECGVKLLCGGGCAAIARNGTGKLKSPDCRPIKTLLALGVAHYFKDEAEHV